jgi:hypothetical protein
MKFPTHAARTALSLGALALAGCGASSTPVTADWHASGIEAKQIALQTHHLLLVAFMGSDWSEPCQAMRKDVLDTQTFKDFADANLVLVMADFPRGSVLPPDLMNQYLQMAKGAQLDRLPVFMLVDPRSGVAFSRIANYNSTNGPDGFISQIRSGVEQYDQALQNNPQAPAVAAATPPPAGSPPPTGPSFSQPAATQPAAVPALPAFPGSLPTPEELMRQQQQASPRPQ